MCNISKVNKKNLFLFCINFLIIGMAYSGLLNMHYAADTYSAMYKSNAFWQLNVGRYSTFALARFFDITGISLVVNQRKFMFISIIILTVSSIILFNLVEQIDSNIECIMGIDIAVILCFVNVYSIELYLFPEHVIYNSIGIFLTIFAVYMLFNKKKYNLVICFVLLFLSLGFYQANISIFIILLLGIAWIRRNETRTIIKGIVIGGLASFINILILRLFVQTGLSSGTERHAELNVVFNNIKILLFDRYSGQRGVLLNSLNLLPRGLFAIFVVFLLGCLVWLGIYKKNKARDFLSTIIIISLMYISVYAPHLISSTLWLSPRTLTALFFFLGILVCMVLKSFYDHRNTAKGIIAILFLFFSINYWSVQGIIVNHFATTKIDQNYARDIYCEIQKYEKATGTEIVSIAPVNDISPLWYNPYVEYTSFDVNKRIVPQEWCDVNLINFVSGRSFYRLEMPDDIYLNYFEGKDWDYYCPEEQLYFKENTLYWCIY